MNVHGQIAHPSSPFTHITRYSMFKLHCIRMNLYMPRGGMYFLVFTDNRDDILGFGIDY